MKRSDVEEIRIMCVVVILLTVIPIGSVAANYNYVESNITSLVYNYAEFFIAFFLVILTYLISRVYNMPLYIDPYGQQSSRLTNRLSKISLLLAYILSFLSFGKYKLLTSSEWRAKKIEEAAEGKAELLEGKFVTGETGEGMRKSMAFALKKSFKVILLTGAPYCTAINDMKKFMTTYPSKFELYVDLNERPKKHFTIIANEDLFLEVPHEYLQVKRYSLGINNAKKELIESYTKKFDEMKKKMKKVTSIEEFDDIVNHCVIRPTPQKDIS